MFTYLSNDYIIAQFFKFPVQVCKQIMFASLFVIVTVVFVTIDSSH